ncbi:unnamed protein product [Gongylonema pulchrum]|uniref:Nonsense-mediated mRNA decay factor SMG8 n=1 Tax=Gongylonema pulchrum TaxID=637853 RepID=A0A183DCU7_9BILA|nr:unnamed protein product [Gongylonema pulchrum]
MEIFQGFFENLSDIETEHTRCLAFLLVYSHALLFVDPGCRFDQSYCRALKHANELRIRLREQISSKLEAVEDFPHAWAVEGRLAQPRFLFAFHRHLLRVDLSSLRRVC